MNDLPIIILSTVNEILTAAIVVIAASMLLYNLTRNLRDRVARTSGVVLGCLTVVYVCDTFLALEPSRQTYAAVLRLQWIGIAFIPVAMYHLSDALLATTGLPSRGRRRRVIRILYVISLVFLLLAALTDELIKPVTASSPIGANVNVMTVQAGTLFPIYCAYFLIATGAAFLNVQLARIRCIAPSTRRRMGYLQIAMLTPAAGIFPFSLLLGPGTELSVLGLAVVNLANIIVIFMLVFLAYPLSFFGSRVPDRIVKVTLLRFFLRGPGTGLLALGTIMLTSSASRIFSLPGEDFTPFAVVAVVLLWQWTVSIILPYLERRLVYPAEDAEQIEKLEGLSDRLLTRGDLMQLLEALLASTLDYLRVSSAFVASTQDPERAEVVRSLGPMVPEMGQFSEYIAQMVAQAEQSPAPFFDFENGNGLARWNGFWLVPLISGRNGEHPLIGILGIQSRAQVIDLTADEQRMLQTLSRRAEQALDDLALQGELFAALEGLLPQVALTRSRAAPIEYRPGRPQTQVGNGEQNGIDKEQFKDQVRAALRHYWGGPGLTSSRLLETELVKQALEENDGNPVKSLRAVLTRGIERLRPEGERKYMPPEWTLYNLLDLRFIQQSRVRDVALKLALGESDLYRKQRIALDQLGDTLWEMEQDLRHSP